MRFVFAVAVFLALLAHGAAADIALPITVRDTRGNAVPDAVIALYTLGGDSAPLAPPAQPVEIAQDGQEFIPYVTVVRAGATVEFPNKDNIQHHLYSLSKAKRFEKPLYAPGAREAVVFDQPGIVTLGCNIHDWMVAYIVVLPTPHFAKTDAQGALTLTAPAGRYRLEVWHPRLGSALTREIELASGLAPLSFDLKLKPDRRIRRAPETKAGPY